MRDGDAVVAEAVEAPFDLDVPEPPTYDEAARASSRYPGFDVARLPDVLRLWSRARGG